MVCDSIGSLISGERVRQVVPNFRVRTIPVLGTTPALFGQAAAAHILCQLACQPIVPEPIFTWVPAYPLFATPPLPSARGDKQRVCRT